MTLPFFINSLVQKMFKQLSNKQLMLVTAESLTGGLLGAEITAISGASRSYWGGVVAYNNEAKHRLLGVDESVLKTCGAVSTETAQAMAAGAAALHDNSLAIAVTGFAGPTGGTATLPVGSVWIAAAIKGRCAQPACVARLYHFAGTRKAIRRKTLRAAFEVGLEVLDRYR